ncbi:MAG: hypothetical protein ACLTYN_14290 [Dysosmobacter welbionis]
MSGTILISVNLSEVPTFTAPRPETRPSPSRRLHLHGGGPVQRPGSGQHPAAGTARHQRGCHLRGQRHLQAGGHRDPVRLPSGSERISQLRFVPASGFTGSVEIPYVACNSSGDPIASGKLCLGIVSAMEDFSDITSSTWCYKYVLEPATPT